MGHALVVLGAAALLGAALGVIRPVRKGIVPRSAHGVQAQILLAIVGAIIIVVVADNLARAFAIVGAAGLVRYRARVDDVKDAGVMLIALALGLTAGAEMFLFAAVACAFVIAVLWLLESLEPPARSRFDLKIATQNAARLRPDIEHALEQKGVTYEIHRSSPTELVYEVTVPYEQKIRGLTKLIRQLDGDDGTQVEWEIKKFETVRPMRRQAAAALLLLVAAPSIAAAQIDIERGSVRAALRVVTHVDWTDLKAGGPDTDVRRARLGVTGSLFERFEYEVERDFRDRTRRWRDAYGNVTVSRALEIRAGRFKVPFSLDQLTSAAELDFVARSLAAQYLAPGRDTGLMAHGRLVGRRVRFQSGVFRGGGDNIRAEERRDRRHGALVAGRLIVRPWNALAVGGAATISRVPDGDYGLRGHTAADVPFFPVIAVSGLRRRYGAEIDWRGGPVAAGAELMRAVDERLGQGVDDETLPALVMEGWYVRGTWLMS